MEYSREYPEIISFFVDYKFCKIENEELWIIWNDQDMDEPAKIFRDADDAVKYTARKNDEAWSKFE